MRSRHRHRARGGASGAGIDASSRLIAVAADRTPDVVAEVHRVLAPGGRLGVTVWGHIKKSEGAWALAPFRLAAPPKVANQAAMVSLGRPGAGEELLGRMGFVDVERVVIPFAWEFADPEAYARALAATGPAYEAIQAVGMEAFLESAIAQASERVREGLPLRAPIDVVGFIARKPLVAARSAGGVSSAVSFLEPPPATPELQAMYDDDVEAIGFPMNVSSVWAHQMAAREALFDLVGLTAGAGGLSFRQRGILIVACASTRVDSYCSLAWGKKLAGVSSDELAGSVLRGDDELLDETERAMAAWARQVARDPNRTTAADVQSLRDVGFDDAQILSITAFVAVRIAFSTVNDALGTLSDHEFVDQAPASVLEAVTFGRPIAPE